MPRLRILYMLSFFLINLVSIKLWAQNVVSFPRKFKSACVRYLGGPGADAKATNFKRVSLRPTQVIDFVDINYKDLDYISSKSIKDYLNFSFDEPSKFSRMTEHKVFYLRPRLPTDHNPKTFGIQTGRWTELTPDIEVKLTDVDFVFLILERKSTVKEGSTYPKGMDLYKALNFYNAVGHTTFKVPDSYRMILQTINTVHQISEKLYRPTNRLQQTRPQIDILGLFETNKLKNQLRNLVSSWQTQNRTESEVRDFLLQHINLSFKKGEDLRFQSNLPLTIESQLNNFYQKDRKLISQELDKLSDDLYSLAGYTNF